MKQCINCDIVIYGAEAANFCSYKCMKAVLGKELAQQLEKEREERLYGYSKRKR